MRPPKPSHFERSLQLFRSQSRLPQVIGQMIGTTQQDGKTVTQRFFQKVFLRHGSVLLQPVSRRETCKPLKQSRVYFYPGLPNQLNRWNTGLRLIGTGNEHDIELGMTPPPKTQQRQHRVMSGREMSPQIDQAVFPGYDFFQEFFFAETGKHFVGSLDVSLPSVQRNRQEQFLVRHEGFLLCFYWIRALGRYARNQNNVQVHHNVQVHPILFIDLSETVVSCTQSVAGLVMSVRPIRLWHTSMACGEVECNRTR